MSQTPGHPGQLVFGPGAARDFSATILGLTKRIVLVIGCGIALVVAGGILVVTCRAVWWVVRAVWAALEG